MALKGNLPRDGCGNISNNKEIRAMKRTAPNIISFRSPDDPKAEGRTGNLPISPRSHPQTTSRSRGYFFFRLDKIYRFIFLFTVIMVAIYPITDAYWDCVCLSTSSDIFAYLNDPDDWVSTKELKVSIADDLKLNHRDLKINNHMCRHDRELVKKTSTRDELVCAKKVDFPVTEEFDQSYHPLSSGLSPPIS